jgi:hypothetical protein
MKDQRRVMLPVGLGLCALGISILSADFGSKNLSARPAPGKVDVEYKSQESFTLHEPVVVTFSVRNGLSKSITLKLGAQYTQYFQFSLTTPEHQILQSSRNPGQDVSVVTIGSGTVTVEAGGKYERPLLLSQFIPLKTPGTYLLTSKLSTEIVISEDGILSPQSKTTQLHISSRDPARLEKVCEELATQAENARTVEAAEFPTLALSYIDDPIAVPFLAKILSGHTLEYDLAIPGLERIGNDDAVESLLSALNDKYGEVDMLARQALTRLQDRISNPNLKETVRRTLSQTEHKSSQ